MDWREVLGIGWASCAAVLVTAILMAASVKGCQICADKKVSIVAGMERICKENPQSCDAALVSIEDLLY